MKSKLFLLIGAIITFLAAWQSALASFLFGYQPKEPKCLKK